MDPLFLLAIGMLLVLGSILLLRLHPFLALFLGALIVAWLTPRANIEEYALAAGMTSEQALSLSRQWVGQRLAMGFGDTCAKIGLLIALASVIGKALLESGAADRIVRTALRLLGDKRAPLAFLGSGFTLGIPVYFDTVFYLLIPLAKSMGIRNERRYLLYVLSTIVGATMAHSLVPPTPGPLFVARALNVDVGAMMLGGVIVGAVTVAFGFLYALWASHRWPVPLRDSVDMSLSDLRALMEREDAELPPFWLAILPILLPVALIAGRTITAIAVGAESAQTSVLRFVANVGDPNIALTIAAGIALVTLALQKRPDRKAFGETIHSALAGAGMIIIITASGGAFGDVLQQTGVGTRIQLLAMDYRISVLPLAFLVTALVRTAQGSATVAMITAVGILAGFAEPSTLGFHPLYLALAIGCGSKPFPWMNDSGFWIVARMSGFTDRETLKTHSIALSGMGVIGIVVVMILARLFPMV